MEVFTKVAKQNGEERGDEWKDYKEIDELTRVRRFQRAGPLTMFWHLLVEWRDRGMTPE